MFQLLNMRGSERAMRILLKPVERDGSSSSTYFEPVPDTCPRCHRAVEPKVGQATINSDQKWAQVVYQCTSDKCSEVFIGNYLYYVHSGYPVYKLDFVSPVKAKSVGFPSSIADVSPSFVEIFNQAIDAEAKGLTQLVGIGIRKALEFLIKDFAVHQHPNDAEKIKAMQLSPCINEYATDPNVKECAKRAVWLGNDETHYIRKWENRDISDLKLLVRLTTNWVDNVLLTQKYVAEMNPGSK
jgi:hypothetical protein